MKQKKSKKNTIALLVSVAALTVAVTTAVVVIKMKKKNDKFIEEQEEEDIIIFQLRNFTKNIGIFNIPSNYILGGIFVMKKILIILAMYLAYVSYRLLISSRGRIKIFSFSIGWRQKGE